MPEHVLVFQEGERFGTMIGGVVRIFEVDKDGEPLDVTNAVPRQQPWEHRWQVGFVAQIPCPVCLKDLVWDGACWKCECGHRVSSVQMNAIELANSRTVKDMKLRIDAPRDEPAKQSPPNEKLSKPPQQPGSIYSAKRCASVGCNAVMTQVDPTHYRCANGHVTAWGDLPFGETDGASGAYG